MKNWKTSLSGILALLTLGFKIYSHGFDPSSDIPIAAAGIGLITAKDKNVTGGTVQQ